MPDYCGKFENHYLPLIDIYDEPDDYTQLKRNPLEYLKENDNYQQLSPSDGENELQV